MTRVAVVCGGPSAEADVSRSSGSEVAGALRESCADVRVVELDGSLARRLLDAPVDVVFPVLHGPPGEDGTLQGFLEILGLPYVGSGVLASATAMHKLAAKQLFRAWKLPIAPDVVVARNDDRAAAVSRAQAELGDAVVVKPMGQGSALGVSFASGSEALEAALDAAFEYGEHALVERRVTGREVTVGLLERNGLEAFPVIEVITPAGAWYDYEHRYTPGLSEHVIPAPLSPQASERTVEVARLAHQALGCRDLSRVDFIVPDEGEPILLEVNTLPGMTPTSLYPDGARAAGIPFEDLVSHLVRRASTRSG